MKNDEKKVLSEMVRTAFVKYLTDYLGEDQVRLKKSTRSGGPNIVILGQGCGPYYNTLNVNLDDGFAASASWLNPKHYLVLTEVQMSTTLQSAKTLGIRKDFAIRLMGKNIVRQVKYAARRYARLIKSINEN